MHIELVDLLRCPNGAHEPTWLVASASEMRERDLVRGTLGCPLCAREFDVREGEADFRQAADEAPAAGERDHRDVAGIPGGPHDAMRLAAFLELGQPGGYVLLDGARAGDARELLSIADVHVIAVNPPPGVTDGDGVSVLRVGDVLPIAAGSLRGAALDRAVHAGFATQCARALQQGARMVLDASSPAPAGMRELASDEVLRVLEKEAASSAPIALARGPQRQR
ncbi:MAG: hypothetical protein JWO05_408 [Gemmatimonadetes bacterium]|nr:hypothetical protein [Gemmatimonadota bacterium]